MSIPGLDYGLRRYIKHFGVISVYVTNDGRIRASRNPPRDAERAYWLATDDVRAVLAVARRNGGNIILAAQACGVALTDHHRMIQRARAAVARLDAQIEQAQRAGLMRYLNIEYQQRRRQARAQGRTFVPYAAVRSRFKRAVIDVAAGGSPTGIVRRVFGDRLPDPQ
jgi:hypothetical protein